MDRFEDTVRKIYEESDIACLGPQNSPLPPEWEKFFEKSGQELRKQQPEPEPEVEGKELLPKILEGLIERIEKNESRIGQLESALEEAASEPVRKGTDPKIALLRMEMAGLCGEWRKRREKWLGN